MKGVGHLFSIPLRAEPSSKSEMVSQILFGETYQVIEQKSDWCLIQTDFDQYQGWINEAQFFHFVHTPSGQSYIIPSSLTWLQTPKIKLALPAGAQVFYQEDGKIETCCGYKGKLLYAMPPGQGILEVAQQFLMAPYLWGGRSYFGIDCSGFVQIAYKILGHALPRDAKDQALVGKTLGFLDNCQAGDLAFFENEQGKIVHVGIMLNPNQIIHAYGHVRVDNIDSTGIWSKEYKKYSHRLRLIKRPFSNA